MSERAKKQLPKGKTLSAFSRMSAKNKLIIFGSIAVIFTFSFPIISMHSGNRFGAAVGTAVGSFHAVTEDMPAAYSQGVEDGISATDIRTANENMLREVGKLDVLVANATLTDTHEYAQKYAALYTFGADVIFSVDISEAVVYMGEGKVIIQVPTPEVEINIDSTKTRLEAEHKQVFFDGSTEKGIDGYLNSMKAIQSDARASLKEYAYLEKRAKSSAEQQIKMLYESISGIPNAEVQFEEKAGDNK